MLWNKQFYCIIPFLLYFSSFVVFMVFNFFIFFSYSVILEYEFLFTNSTAFSLSFYVDWVSLLFSSFVFFIGGSVLSYSKSYMISDKYINRFFFLVFAFIMSMMATIFSLNMVSILLGWDGLGISSYLLVVYYQNEKSNSAGMITAMTNRLGDVAILIMIGLMVEFGSWNFMNIMKIYFIFSILVVLAAMTKSAQMPFSSWLPAAMAAPTPVSALVHSSTLVTAGVYLLIRFEPALSQNLKYFLFFISCMTMFMASLSANMNFDLKKVIALSTLSQLGVMISVISIGLPMVSFFHLLTHAIFKSLLFLCAGKIIHNVGGTQDIRFMGSVFLSLPLTTFIMGLSSMALIGFPFMAGFYSKDLLIECFMKDSWSMWGWVIFFISTGLSSSYSARLIFFIMNKSSGLMSLSYLEDSDFMMLNYMLILSFFSVFFGCLLGWFIFTSPLLVNICSIDKFMALVVTFSGIVLGMFVNLFFSPTTKINSLLVMFSSMWFLPFLSTKNLNNFVLTFGHFYFFTLDSTWSEYLGSKGAFQVLSGKGYSFIYQNNDLKVFIMMFLFFLMFYV
uniref:NADH-ubiquinone oxidoreductase chain 5 n=1 Tax=Dimorphostylis asiatica TaxID=2840398 RepID=A0A8F8AFH3_9CRUS|nr:NADH dehydrogenase subunit 5 [Dimorphostylis asiatica]